MRKSPFVIALVVVVVAIVGAPFLLGIFAEKQIKQFVQTISPNADVKVTLQSYHRGWFKSDVTFAIQVNSSQIHRLVNQISSHPLDPQIQSLVFNGKTTIYHGPMIFNKEIAQSGFVSFGKAGLVFNANLSPESQKMIMNTVTGTFPAITGISKVGFGDNILITLNSAALNLQQKDTDNAVHFSALKGKWNISLNDKFIDGSYELNGFGLSGNGMTVSVDNLITSYQGEGEIFNITPHLGIMDETIKIPHAVVQQNQKTIFELNNGKVFNQAVLNNNQYDVTQIIEVDKAMLGDKTYGPGRYIVVFKHIDPATANQFIKQLSSFKSVPSSKERDYLALTSVSTFSQLFMKGAELELSLDLLTPEGPVAARSQAMLNKEQATAAVSQLTNPIDVQSAFNFIKKLKLNFELKLPIALTEKVFTAIDLQYLQHQKTIQKEAATANTNDPAAIAAINPQISVADKSDEEIQQMAEQNAKQQLLDLVNKGSLIENNGSYQLNIELNNGQLLVNGKNIQANPQNEPGVTPVQAAQPIQPIAAPVMLLAPNAVKETEQPVTQTEQGNAASPVEINPAPSANHPMMKETTTTTTTTTKKTSVSQ